MDIKAKLIKDLKPSLWKIDDEIKTQVKPLLAQLLREIQEKLLRDSSLPVPTLQTISHSLGERDRWSIILDKDGVKIVQSVTGEQKGNKLSVEDYVRSIDSLDQIKTIARSLEFHSEHPRKAKAPC